ncbi:uncharacterized protein JCM15063_003812 [Sporobolomyces koalae]|uniref:uncharacterized protein n=1 Tax=Sporobolomyces koalae TaxID=500713 RepID=UPI003179C6BF
MTLPFKTDTSVTSLLPTPSPSPPAIAQSADPMQEIDSTSAPSREYTEAEKQAHVALARQYAAQVRALHLSAADVDVRPSTRDAIRYRVQVEKLIGGHRVTKQVSVLIPAHQTQFRQHQLESLALIPPPGLRTPSPEKSLLVPRMRSTSSNAARSSSDRRPSLPSFRTLSLLPNKSPVRPYRSRTSNQSAAQLDTPATSAAQSSPDSPSQVSSVTCKTTSRDKTRVPARINLDTTSALLQRRRAANAIRTAGHMQLESASSSPVPVSPVPNPRKRRHRSSTDDDSVWSKCASLTPTHIFEQILEAMFYETYSPYSPQYSTYESASPSFMTHDAYLPDSYASYDQQRIRLEQAILARKQRERRQAEAAAYLAQQERLQRQAAIEEAIRQERERRAIAEEMMYREAVANRARQEELLQRRYTEALQARQAEATRRRYEAEQQQQQRRAERARSNARPSSQHVDDDFLKALFGCRQTQESNSEPSATRRLENPQPDLFKLFFGPQATPARDAQPKTPSPTTEDKVKTAAVPATAPAAEPATEQPADAPSSDDEAATTVQRHFRRHLARRNALARLSTLASKFSTRQTAFEKPLSFTFQQRASTIDSSSPAPPLAFGSANSSFLSYEDFLVKLLSDIDAVESGGDRQVKQERKQLVRNVEKELARLDAMKERAWEEQIKTVPVAENEPEPNEAEVPASAESSEVFIAPTESSTSEPAQVQPAHPTPAPDAHEEDASSAISVDDIEPLLPAPTDADTSPAVEQQLTEAAVSTLAPEPSANLAPAVDSPPSESGSSSTSSTLTESSLDESPMSDLIDAVLKRAEKLGAEVQRQEMEEAEKSLQKEPVSDFVLV